MVRNRHARLQGDEDQTQEVRPDQSAASRRVGVCAFRTWKTKSKAKRLTIEAIVSPQSTPGTSISSYFLTRNTLNPGVGADGPTVTFGCAGSGLD